MATLELIQELQQIRKALAAARVHFATGAKLQGQTGHTREVAALIAREINAGVNLMVRSEIALVGLLERNSPEVATVEKPHLLVPDSEPRKGE